MALLLLFTLEKTLTVLMAMLRVAQAVQGRLAVLLCQTETINGGDHGGFSALASWVALPPASNLHGWRKCGRISGAIPAMQSCCFRMGCSHYKPLLNEHLRVQTCRSQHPSAPCSCSVGKGDNRSETHRSSPEQRHSLVPGHTVKFGQNRSSLINANRSRELLL